MILQYHRLKNCLSSGLPFGLELDFKSKKCLEKEIDQMVYTLYGLTAAHGGWPIK
jgi:hypothetical protein